MRSAIILLFLIFSTACTVESQKVSENPQPEIQNPQSKQPVLVELFTSQGWISCPAADRALAFLEKEQPVPQAEIITLALHVDYWNYLGWKDEFSSPLFSNRQEFYTRKFKLDSSYTPQMVVDGKWEFTGSDLGKASKAIFEASKAPKAKVEISKSGEKFKIKVSDLPEHENTTVFLAIAEDNLSSNVIRGENKGKSLEHQSVARELKAVGSISARQKSFELETFVNFQPEWKADNLKLIVFLQENDSRKILGIGRFYLEKN